MGILLDLDGWLSSCPKKKAIEVCPHCGTRRRIEVTLDPRYGGMIGPFGLCPKCGHLYTYLDEETGEEIPSV